MHHMKVVAVVCLFVAVSQAAGAGYGGSSGTQGGHGYGGAAATATRSFTSPARPGSYGGGSYNPAQSYPPQPYNFDYQARDEQGNTHYRQEQGDNNGAVRGSYGYTDAQGLYRVVEYVADANGFRANVRSNEPGVGKDSPADVVLTAIDPPAGIQDRYTRGGGSGYRAQAGSYSTGVVSGAGFPAGGSSNFGHSSSGHSSSGFHGSKGAY